jgi:hypothetical protein
VYASNASGKWELYAWDRRADQHRQVTDRPEGTITGRPHPSGETIWWFDDEKGNEFGRWVVEPFDGSAPPAPAASEVDPAYSAGLALGRSVAVIGSSGGEGSRIHVARNGAAHLIYRHPEEVEVGGLSRDEGLVCFHHSEHGDSRHPALRVTTLEGDQVADLWDGPGRGLFFAGWSRVPGDRRVLLLHERRDLARPMLWWPETERTEELDVDLPGEVEASWYPDGRAVLVGHDYRGRAELLRLDLATGAVERLDAEPGTAWPARVRPDGEVWYRWSSSSTPPEIRSSSGAVVLRAPGEPAPLGVAYTDHDVDGVHVFVAEPSGSRPYPTIFVIHGGPPSHDGDEFSPYNQAWVDHGFAVVLVNYRGSTGYGRAWRDALEGNPGFTELEDIARVHDWVVGEGIADPKRVILSGSSWGGT